VCMCVFVPRRFMISSKFYDDVFLNNARYARVGGGKSPCVHAFPRSYRRLCLLCHLISEWAGDKHAGGRDAFLAIVGFDG
jgi:hypothetical protein